MGCGCVGVWVCGCVGVWVCGCVGVWVWMWVGTIIGGISGTAAVTVPVPGNREKGRSASGMPEMHWTKRKTRGVILRKLKHGGSGCTRRCDDRRRGRRRQFKNSWKGEHTPHISHVSADNKTRAANIKSDSRALQTFPANPPITIRPPARAIARGSSHALSLTKHVHSCANTHTYITHARATSANARAISHTLSTRVRRHTHTHTQTPRRHHTAQTAPTTHTCTHRH